MFKLIILFLKQPIVFAISLFGFFTLPLFASFSTQPLLESSFDTSLSKSPFKWELNAMTESYIRSGTPYYSTSEKFSEMSIFGFNVGFEHKKETSHFFSQFKGFYSLNEEQIYFSIPEVYYEFSYGSSAISIGKKRIPWFSKIDEIWDLGLWSPRFKWDPLRPEYHGFLGLFYKKPFSSWQISAFAQPMLTPDYGVNVDSTDGKISTHHPWFNPLPHTVELLGVETNLSYDINTSSLFDQLIKPGFGVHLQNLNNDFFNWSMAYSYKPSHQLLLKVPISFEIQETGKDVIYSEVRPQTYYHHLLSLEGKWQTNNWVFVQNLNYEIPKNPTIDKNVVIKNLSKAFYLSSYLGYNIKTRYDNSIHLFTSLLYNLEDEAEVRGEVDLPDNLFPDLRVYRQALSFGFQWPFKILNKLAVLNNKMVYDFKQKGGLISSEIRFNISPSLNVYFLADFLGIISEDAPSSMFLIDYRANDRIQSGVTYVF